MLPRRGHGCFLLLAPTSPISPPPHPHTTPLVHTDGDQPCEGDKRCLQVVRVVPAVLIGLLILRNPSPSSRNNGDACPSSISPSSPSSPSSYFSSYAPFPTRPPTAFSALLQKEEAALFVLSSLLLLSLPPSPPSPPVTAAADKVSSIW